jgi:hypothetical protein
MQVQSLDKYRWRKEGNMKKGNTFKENIEFLIMMYKRELATIDKDIEKGERSYEEKEMIECYLIELQTIIDLSK